MNKLYTKKGLIALSILVQAAIYPGAKAQTLNLQNVTKQGFSGLEPLDNSGYYIKYYEGLQRAEKGKKAIFHIYSLNNDLEIRSDFKLELLPSDEIEDLSFNSGNYFLIYSNVAKKTRTFKLLSSSGNELASKVIEDVKYRNLGKPAVIIPAGDSDFIVINYIKDKKIGYSIEKYNSKMEAVFSSNQTPEKGKLYPVDYLLSAGKLFVLEFADRDFDDHFEYYVNSFDLTNGTSVNKTYLTSEDGKKFGYPSFIRASKNGGVIAGGMYFDNQRVQETNSDGFFSTYIPSQGKPVSTYIDWKLVKDQVGNGSTSAMWGGKNKTFMHDISVNADGSYVLIGENYRKGDSKLSGDKSKNGFAIASKALSVSGGDESDLALTAAEFVLFDFDASGAYKGIRTIDKPNSVTILKASTEDRPFGGEFKGLNIANILNNYGYFPYRFTAETNNGKYLVYYLKHEKKPEELVYFTPLNATTAENTHTDITGGEMKVLAELNNKVVSSLGLGNAFAKLNKIAKATGTDDSEENVFEVKGSHDPFDFRAKHLNSRIYPSNIPGKILVYDFVPNIDEKEKNNFLAKMINSANGSMKIYYLDIPVK